MVPLRLAMGRVPGDITHGLGSGIAAKRRRIQGISRGFMRPIVLIPARMASTRLPGKPLADIAGTPMIVRVWQQAMKAAIGPVLVAAAEGEIVAAVEAAGGKAVLTDPDLPSGSDRIFQALQRVDPDGAHDTIVNLQG